jgi:hypothetical protein
VASLIAIVVGGYQLAHGEPGAKKKPAASARLTMDLAFTYDASRGNIVSGSNFWMQGGSFQIHGQFWRRLGAVADTGCLHFGDAQGTGVGLDLVTATFEPRFT